MVPRLRAKREFGSTNRYGKGSQRAGYVLYGDNYGVFLRQTEVFPSVQKVPAKWNIVHTGNEQHAFTSEQTTPKALMSFGLTNSTENGDAGADLLYERTH
jgi:hypothetical protein